MESSPTWEVKKEVMLGRDSEPATKQLREDEERSRGL